MGSVVKSASVRQGARNLAGAGLVVDRGWFQHLGLVGVEGRAFVSDAGRLKSTGLGNDGNSTLRNIVSLFSVCGWIRKQHAPRPLHAKLWHTRKCLPRTICRAPYDSFANYL